jgi:Tfp pilus assembly protein PilF
MRAWFAAAALGLLFGAVDAAPRIPQSDDSVVESLPAIAGWASLKRRLNGATQPGRADEATAIATSRAYLDLAREQGDARYAGYAMGALQAWNDRPAAETPPAVLLMRATVAQYLHDFDSAERLLRTAIARDPKDSQAWITLATVLRVRGRYGESDTACRSLGRAGPALFAIACLAENQALRGQYDAAREALSSLLADPAVAGPSQAATRQWLLTSLAEVEELAGNPTRADAAYRRALNVQRSGYLLLAYSDYLQRVGRGGEVRALLAQEARSDAVLLRLAIAAAAGASQPDARELAERFEAAAQRPGTTALHAREEAMFALDVQQDPKRALTLARLNADRQREPIDLLIYARAAAASGEPGARAEVRALADRIGLKDTRVDDVLR